MDIVKKFFTAIGTFLNNAEEYFDNRVRTGKFIGDIKYYSKIGKENTSKVLKSLFIKGIHSPYYVRFTEALKKLWILLMKVQFLEWTFSLALDAVKIFFKYYAEIFITFALTFPTAILLLNLFQSNITAFFIALLPLLIFNVLCLSALYFTINKREEGSQISLWQGFVSIVREKNQIVLILCFHFAILVLAGVSFSILSLFFRFFFDAIAISWGDSIIYWFVVIFTGLILLIWLFIMNVILHQTLFIKLFEPKSLTDAYKESVQFIKGYTIELYCFYLLLYLFGAVVIFWSTLYYLYAGFTVSVFGFTIIGLFLGFLLRRKFYRHSTVPAQVSTHNYTQLFTIIVFFGLVNFVLGSTVVISQFQYITTIFESQRSNYFLNREMITYTNNIHNFSVQHPKSWSIYERRDRTVTFYNNNSGTETGGIWLNISVASFDERAYLRLYNARPGLVSLDTTTKDVTTKISNIQIQGYEGVNYTFYKVKEPYPEYQTHYLIKKGNDVYDIVFITLNKDIEENNTETFERIINSFTFIE